MVQQCIGYPGMQDMMTTPGEGNQEQPGDGHPGLPGRLPWIRTIDRLPGNPGEASCGHVDCIVFHVGECSQLSWNVEHQCWDDTEGDDYYCDAMEPTHWFRLTPPTD